MQSGLQGLRGVRGTSFIPTRVKPLCGFCPACLCSYHLGNSCFPLQWGKSSPRDLFKCSRKYTRQLGCVDVTRKRLAGGQMIPVWKWGGITSFIHPCLLFIAINLPSNLENLREKEKWKLGNGIFFIFHIFMWHGEEHRFTQYIHFKDFCPTSPVVDIPRQLSMVEMVRSQCSSAIFIAGLVHIYLTCHGFQICSGDQSHPELHLGCVWLHLKGFLSPREVTYSLCGSQNRPGHDQLHLEVILDQTLWFTYLQVLAWDQVPPGATQPAPP